MLVDSHCHLDRINLDKYDDGLDGAVSAAKARGISHMLCVCISEENKAAVLDIASRFEGISASVGIHPSDVKEEVISEDTLLQWADAPKVVAIGETGLDYYYTGEFAKPQQESFINHLQVAKAKSLPVIVHTREAREDTIALIKSHGCRESAGVLHCFTESWEMAEQALDLNYYISISGIVTFKNALELKEVAKKIPADRLLVETDSPYLAPVPYRGKPNEPKYVREVAEYVAELRGVSLESLAEQTSDNYFRLFSKAAV
ncbi:MAG: TatD family hydrolase [Agarilytica sp.]